MKRKSSPIIDSEKKRRKVESPMKKDPNFVGKLSFKDQLEDLYKDENNENEFTNFYDQNLSYLYKENKNDNMPNLIRDNLSNEFLYDHSIIKQLDIVFNFPNSEAELALEELKQFFDETKLEYYEFSNTSNDSVSSNLNFIEINKFDHYFDNSVNQSEKAKSQIINYTNYMEALSSLIKNFHTKENFFYIITPLISIYFFKVPFNTQTDIWNNKHNALNEPGILISNTFTDFDKKVSEHGIKFNKITQKSIKKSKRGRKKSTDEIYSQYQTVNDNFEESANSLIYVRNVFNQQFFNFLVNEYEDKYFKILSPFPFDNAVFKLCKVTMEKMVQNDKTSINIKIFGCIFSTQLEQILQYFQKKYKFFSLKFHHLHKTNGFYIINSKLENFVERSDFYDSNYGHK